MKPKLDRQMEKYYGSFFGAYEDQKRKDLQELSEQVSKEIVNQINSRPDTHNNTVIIQNLNVSINYASGGGATINTRS